MFAEENRRQVIMQHENETKGKMTTSKGENEIESREL